MTELALTKASLGQVSTKARIKEIVMIDCQRIHLAEFQTIQ